MIRMEALKNPTELQVTAALISAHGRLFIAQRPPAKKFGLLWEFPGGKVEPGEKLEDSLVREISEELCWHITVGKLFRRLRHNYSDFNIDLHAFWCSVTQGSLCLKEHVAYHWARIEELKHFQFTTADQQLICHLEQLTRLPQDLLPSHDEYSSRLSS
jgi:8-oxo-dGTP diphosphatase